MSTAQFSAIQRLLAGGRKTAKRSKVWTRIHEETGVGVIIGSELAFTASEVQRLRKYAEHLTGLDPQYENLAGGRMEMADKSSHEKQATGSVFGSLLVMATAGNARLVINNQEVKSPVGSVICATPDSIDRQALARSRVVLVENGAPLTYKDDIKLPTAWENSVLLYRGHGDNARDVERIVAEHPDDLLALYYDFDPEGLAMALGHGKGEVLIPENWTEFVEGNLDFDNTNQRDSFRRQSSSMKRLEALAAGTAWEAITAAMKKNEVAIMQEHVTVRHWPLTNYPKSADQ